MVAMQVADKYVIYLTDFKSAFNHLLLRTFPAVNEVVLFIAIQ
jgi:hypothetical protein